MSSRQVPPGSPLDGDGFRDETIPLADYGSGEPGLNPLRDHGMAQPMPAAAQAAPTGQVPLAGQVPQAPPTGQVPPPGQVPQTPLTAQQPPPAHGPLTGQAPLTPPAQQPPPARADYSARPAAPRAAAQRAGAAVETIAREMRTPETKESFKTSEFMVLLLGVIGVLLAAEVSAEFNAPQAWMAITILSVGYLLSRGFAKAGTSRESSRSAYTAASAALDAAASDPSAPRSATGQRSAAAVADQLSTPETKVFYKSTEFMLWALGVIGILLAAQANAEFDATGAWRLISYLSAGYIISRGLAKAASDRGYSDPNYGLATDAAGRSNPARSQEADEFTRRHISTPETKEFFKTSEFLVLVLTTFGIAVAANVDLFFDAASAWTFLTIVGAAYMVSRGLAKLGTRDPHLYG